MEVLIVSKTRMQHGVCAGGLVLETKRYVRLMEPGNRYQPSDTPLEIGQVWNIRAINRNPVHPPHVEDIIVLGKTLVRQVDNMAAFIQGLNTIDHNGGFDGLFGGLVRRTSAGTGYIPADGDLPRRSVGFWISDRPLTLLGGPEKAKYIYTPQPDARRMSYVGFPVPIDEIPAGTILRVSLSRLYAPPGDVAPSGYYLQLSGWYQATQGMQQGE